MPPSAPASVPDAETCSAISARMAAQPVMFEAASRHNPCSSAGGQLVSVLTGCVVRNIFPDSVSWVAAPVAVGVALFLMMLTRTVHPPGAYLSLFLFLLPGACWCHGIALVLLMLTSTVQSSAWMCWPRQRWGRKSRLPCLVPMVLASLPATADQLTESQKLHNNNSPD